MKKYTVRYNITVPFEFEIEAESDSGAKNVANRISNADLLQDFADTFNGDFSYADVDVECIFDGNGNYVYDGIGL